jgi:asparagine synthase (glutamine-hydrolysing)
MCGIAGIVAPGVERAEVDRMLAAISHRGPDELGTYDDAHAAVGAARLSIIDLVRGAQPMRDAETGFNVFVNGEIYNHPELREELQARGHRFDTLCDTEVVLRACLEYGDGFVERLNGQFALGLWHPGKRRLVLARDRIGIRPLYYWHSGETFVFGSEIKSLLASGRVPRRIDERALDHVFTFWVPVADRSIVENVREVPPGCRLVLEDGRVRIERYWDWPFPRQDGRLEGDARSLRGEFLDALRRSVELRLRADVEVGAYLSGGIDSSSIVSLVSDLRPAGLRTFSIGFEEESYDERPFQEIVSRRHGTLHHCQTCDYDDIERHFAAAVWHAETPLFRTAPTPLFMLSQAVRDAELKVVLTGEGADEVLLGYDLFREVRLRRFWARRPDSKMRPQLFRRLYAYLPQFKNPRYANLAIQSFKASLDSDSPHYSHEIRWANSIANKGYYSDGLRERLEGVDPLQELSAGLPEGYHEADDIDRAQYLEIATLLRGYLLASQGDRMSMAHSVEGRYPFLDHEFVEFCSRLPRRAKLAGLKDKHVLRVAMEGRLPETICRRPKIAYQAPEIRPFVRADGRRSTLVDRHLSGEALRESGLFAPDRVERLVRKAEVSDQARMGTRDNMAFVQILSSQILFDRFVREDPADTARRRLDRLEFAIRIDGRNGSSNS